MLESSVTAQKGGWPLSCVAQKLSPYVSMVFITLPSSVPSPAVSVGGYSVIQGHSLLARDTLAVILMLSSLPVVVSLLSARSLMSK